MRILFLPLLRSYLVRVFIALVVRLDVNLTATLAHRVVTFTFLVELVKRLLYLTLTANFQSCLLMDADAGLEPTSVERMKLVSSTRTLIRN